MVRWTTFALRRPAEAWRRLGVLAGLAGMTALVALTPALADDRPDGSELATAAGMMIVIGLFFVVGGLGMWWSWRNGEFEEPEDIKYQMLAMAEDEPDYWGIGAHDRDADDLDEDEDEDQDDEVVAPPRKQLAAPGAGKR